VNDFVTTAGLTEPLLDGCDLERVHPERTYLTRTVRRSTLSSPVVFIEEAHL
jgi:hypothetical protein